VTPEVGSADQKRLLLPGGCMGSQGNQEVRKKIMKHYDKQHLSSTKWQDVVFMTFKNCAGGTL
jgi:hypothetical protein